MDFLGVQSKAQAAWHQTQIFPITECPQSKAEAASTIEKVDGKLQWFEWAFFSGEKSW